MIKNILLFFRLNMLSKSVGLKNSLCHYLEQKFRLQTIQNDSLLMDPGFRLTNDNMSWMRAFSARLVNRCLLGLFAKFRTLFLSIFLTLSLITPTESKATGFRDLLETIASITCADIHAVIGSFSPNSCTPILAPNPTLDPGPFIVFLQQRLFINHKAFPGNCARSNRSNPYHPTIDFGFCRNIMITGNGAIKGLLPMRVVALYNVIVNLAINVFTGKNPWPDVKKDWYIPPEDYVEKHNNAKPGEIGFFIDVNIPPMVATWDSGSSSVFTPDMLDTLFSYVVVFPWFVSKINDSICVNTIGAFGVVPGGCKFMMDPYVISKYHYFFHKNPPDPNAPGVEAAEAQSLLSCFGSQSCYINANTHAKAILPMSSGIVSCVNQMLVNVLISPSICSFDQISQVYNDSAKRASSPLYRFQQKMGYAVTALLSLYVIITAMKMILGGEVPERGEMIKFVVKIILVTYFSIGINFNNNASGFRYDGMTEFILPFVFGGANELASIIMNLAPSGLCKFDMAKYDDGYAYLALWDSLDCRVSNYLGLDGIADMTSSGANGNANFDALNFSVPPWIFLLIPAILTGNLSVIGLVLSYPFLVISVASYMVYSFIVCIISITILSILSPIFIPMVLFEYTKGYYDSWVKLIISFVLQPMVVAIFMITMFSVYDFGFFGSCKFKAINVSTIFDGSTVNRKFFTIDQDTSSYAGE
ncbi:MAG: type IV secretion system protein, partial [Rickettsiaceae bacterium]|nr:type IV secretion system protein [Rickettsiaceae bacterium]